MAHSQYDIFIDRMIDTLRDHTNPILCPEADHNSGQKLWHMTTPLEYFDTVHEAFQGNTDAELRARIKKAPKQNQIARVMFLILVLLQLPEYRLKDGDRRPWR